MDSQIAASKQKSNDVNRFCMNSGPPGWTYLQDQQLSTATAASVPLWRGLHHYLMLPIIELERNLLTIIYVHMK